nr:MAG TPA: hypothetical protein [Crassvirales sp.]
MKKTILLCSFAAIVAFVAGLKAGQPNDLQVANYSTLQHKTELIKAYDAYNKATEELLDTLDNQYDWVDAIDSYDYYESRAKLDSLLWEAN